MRNENFITIQGWMVNELELSGNDLICYAVIYGFSQDDNYWEGSQTYLSEWLGISRRTTIDVLNRLILNGHIDKQEYEVNKVKFCKYKAVVPNFTRCEESAHCIYNIDNHKEERDKSLSKKDTINYAEILLQWKKINPNLKQPRMIDEKRKKAIRTLLKNNNATIEDLYKAFQMISISSFCNANHEKNRKWEATFDWIIKDTNGCFNRLLEGQFALTDTEKTLSEKITNGEWDESFSSKITSSPYHPYGNTSIMYDEINHCYMYIAYSYSMIADGYTDDERPDGAVLVLNSGRGTLTWSKAERKWIHKK